MRSISLILVLAFAGLSPAFAQTEINKADERRLLFYSDKILGELHAIVDAQKAGDQAVYVQHHKALATITDRWIGAASKAGLAGSSAEKYFREYFAANYTGRIPSDFANDIGLVSLASLVAGLENPLPDVTDTVLVDVLRAAGSENSAN